MADGSLNIEVKQVWALEILVWILNPYKFGYWNFSRWNQVVPVMKFLKAVMKASWDDKDND